MKLTLQQIAEQVAGHVRPESAQDKQITGLAAADDAGPADLTFFGNAKYLKKVRESQAGAVLVPLDMSEELPQAVVRVENPSYAFSQLLEAFSPPVVEPDPGVHPSAVIGDEAEVPASCRIGANAVIGPRVTLGENTVIHANVTIGESAVLGRDCQIYSGATIREHCRLGDRVIIHCGAVIGSDGFGFELVRGRHQKIPQRGIVRVDDDVEIGANTTIDRARFGKTWIQEGVKIDNLVQIAHNVVVGKHSVIVSQAGVSGSTRLGQYVTLAGQVGVIGHLEIGDQAVIAAQSGISKSVPPQQIMFGSPAQPMREAKKAVANVNRLPRLIERVRELETQLKELKETLEK
jgi:UDP-3-O-[3-hydroxymyristoyl] glucosamine N-acyltransferase